MNGKPIHIFLAFLLWALMMLGATSYYGWSWLVTELEIPQHHQIYTVNRGQSLYSVADDLKQKNIIRWPRLWVQYARVAGLENIKSGEYPLEKYESPLSILKKINEGKVKQHQLTLIEGQTYKAFYETIVAEKKLNHSLAKDEILALLKEMGMEHENPEGWLFPDTYSFSKGDTGESIVVRAYNKMKQVLDEEWEQRAENLPYKNAYEALIMASIVEKETGAAFEREKIAGVFVRRLNKKMRLQTDPTVIYGMGEKYKGNITRKDLKTPTPYNTYVIKGLPPTPIAMPGREAIYAALHPADGDELYFVAKGDGTHQFSATLEEHEAAVREYQLKRRKNYRSTVK